MSLEFQLLINLYICLNQPHVEVFLHYILIILKRQMLMKALTFYLYEHPQYKMLQIL